jgi:O-antigen/teichoic acid export membrane protein
LSLSLFGVWGFFRTRFQLRTQYHLAVGNVGISSLIQAASSLSRPIIACVAVYFSNNFLSLPIAYILCEIISFSLAYIFDKKPYTDKFSKYKVKRIFSFGLGNGVSSLAGQAANYIQPLFITMTLGVSYIPLYICTLTSAIMLQRFMLPIVGVWFPSLIRWNVDNENSDFLPPDFKKLLFYGTCVSILAGLITGLLNHIFVKLWVGEEMFAGSLFSWLVALQVPLFFLGNVAGTVLRAYAVTPRPIVTIATIELGLTCLLSMPAFAYFGLSGGLVILTFVRMLGIYLSSKSAFNNYKVKHL